MSTRAPAMYISHGSPMFALEPGKAGKLLNDFSQHLKDTKAVLIVSPHWMYRGLSITAAEQLDTIHDFYGFPNALYRVTYNASGSQDVAESIQAHLKGAGFAADLNTSRGRDHGAWVPMVHLLPRENLPVLQLSLDNRMSPEELYALGEALKGLRDEGIAIIGSGSLTHNLYEIQHANAPAVDYAQRFEQWARARVQERNVEQLSQPQRYCEDFKRSHPTAEHYVTLLVALGASDESEELHVLDGGIIHGVISMESYAWTAA